MEGEIDGDEGVWKKERMSDRHMLVARQRSEVFGKSQGDVTTCTWCILLYFTPLLD